MSELFEEIQEDIRRERIGNIWRSVGRFAVWGSIGIVAVTAILVVHDGYYERIAEEKTTKLIRASERMAAADYKTAVSIYSEITEDYSSPSYALAMLKKAEAQELSGDVEGAKKTYTALVNQKNEYGEIAQFHLDASASKTDGVFAQTGKENKAWALLAAGKKNEAAALFFELTKDENSPRTLAERATEVVRTIAPEKLMETKEIK